MLHTHSGPAHSAGPECFPMCPQHHLDRAPPPLLGCGSACVVEGERTLLAKTSIGSAATEQCKNGGYVQYGFPNQGQCIQFVNTER